MCIIIRVGTCTCVHKGWYMYRVGTCIGLVHVHVYIRVGTCTCLDKSRYIGLRLENLVASG